MSNRTRDYYRKMRAKHIQKKYHILTDVWHDYRWSEHIKDSLGVLSKNKIHCSCPLCAFHGITVSDLRKLGSIDYSLRLLEQEDWCDVHVRHVCRVQNNRRYDF